VNEIVGSGLVLLAIGIVTEIVFGTKGRNFLDLSWIKQSVPGSGEWAKVVAARVIIVLGTALVLGGAVSTWV
jgi:hypothetical protein